MGVGRSTHQPSSSSSSSSSAAAGASSSLLNHGDNSSKHTVSSSLSPLNQLLLLLKDGNSREKEKAAGALMNLASERTFQIAIVQEGGKKLNCIALHCIALHCITFESIALHKISFPVMRCRCTTAKRTSQLGKARNKRSCRSHIIPHSHSNIDTMNIYSHRSPLLCSPLLSSALFVNQPYQLLLFGISQRMKRTNQ